MKRIAAALALVAALGLSVAYFVRANRAQPGRESARSGAGAAGLPVIVRQVVRSPIRRTVTLLGTLRADRQAAITARVPSRVLSVLVHDGARVRVGDVLVLLDIGDAAAQIAGAEAGVKAAGAQFEKASVGKRARAIELDAAISQAESGLKIARSRLRQAEVGATLSGSSAVSDRDRAEAGLSLAQAALSQAEVGLKLADQTLGRMRRLYAKGGIARADLEGARAQADIARSQRDSALAGVRQARAALAPAAASLPLRTVVSQADSDAARAGVQQAEEGVASARKARTEALRVCDHDIEAARAAVDQARAGEDQARAQIGAATIVSPVDGVVTDVTTHPGEYAQPGMPLMTVVSSDEVHLEAAAASRLSGDIRKGQDVRVFVDNLPDRQLDGVVTDAAPVIGSDNRTFVVRIRFVPRVGGLLPGATARASIEISRNDAAPAVPVDAIRSEGNLSFVYTVVNGKALRKYVELGPIDGDMAPVLSGVRTGDRVIVSAPMSLQSGDVVAPVMP